jgi:hypothetical protein
MTVTTWNLFRTLVGLERGVWCRACGDAIAARDELGTGERVCRACR